MPADFRFVSNEVQLWTPAAFTPADRADDRRHSNSWQMLARLKPGASIGTGQQQIDALNARNLDRFPHFKELLVNAGFRTYVLGFHDDLVSESRGTLWLLWGFATFVLLIGALNVANLVSVRATAQVRELVTRLALGASLGSLTRQIFTEALVLTSVGGALGLLLGWWALRAAPVLGLDALPRGAEIGLDGWVAAYTLGLVAVVGMLVALVPVLRLRHVDVAGAIREEGRSGTATRRTLVVRRVLVAGQVAFALVLLIGAGLLLASFDRILAVNPGFNPNGVFTGRISLPVSRYGDDQAVLAAYDRLLPALRAIPGVTAAGLTGSLPFGGDYSDSVILAEGYQMAPGESVISPSQINITEGLVDALGMSLVRGRAFTTADGQGAPRAVLVDERLAQRFWPDQDPIGRRMFLPSDANDLLKPPPDDGWLTVVGVVGNVRLRALAEGGGNSGLFGAYYFPIAQVADRGVAIVLRTSQITRLAHLGGPGGRARDGSVGAAVRRPHHGLASRRRPHRPAHADDPGGVVCGGRAPAGGDRPLRRAGVSGRPARAGDRHPDGLGRQRSGDLPDGAARRRAGGRRRGRHRARRRVADAPDDAGPALRSGRDGPARDRGRRRRAGRRGAGRLRAAGAACRGHRPGGGVDGLLKAGTEDQGPGTREGRDRFSCGS